MRIGPAVRWWSWVFDGSIEYDRPNEEEDGDHAQLTSKYCNASTWADCWSDRESAVVLGRGESHTEALRNYGEWRARVGA